MSVPVRHFAPGAGLDAVVAAFWVRLPEKPLVDPAPPIRVLPDGCIDLIWRFRRQAAGSLADARLYVAGVRSRWHWASADGATTFVGVRLRPGVSRLLLQVDPTDLRSIDPPAAALDPTLADVEDRLADAASPERMLEVLRDETLRRTASAPGSRRPPRRVRRALTLLDRGDPAATVARVAAMLEISPRSLHRNVVEWTGLSPRTRSRIGRFQAALDRLRQAPGLPLARLAHEVGYADHAHLTREFRTLAGVPPSAACAI